MCGSRAAGYTLATSTVPSRSAAGHTCACYEYSTDYSRYRPAALRDAHILLYIATVLKESTVALLPFCAEETGRAARKIVMSRIIHCTVPVLERTGITVSKY